MRPILDWFSRLLPRRKRRASSHTAREALLAQLEVGTLEPRYVLNAAGAGALVPQNQTTPSSTPTSSTTSSTTPSSLYASIDASGNLVVEDNSSGAHDNQLQVRIDAAQGTIELYDPTQIFSTTIEGAIGDGTNRLILSLDSFSGDQIQINTGAGNDFVSIDLAETFSGAGNLAKEISLQGGSGIDTLELIGQHTSSIAYTFSDTSTSISVTGPRESSSINAQLELDDFEPIVDRLTSDSRSFVFVDASVVNYYGTNSAANSATSEGLEQLAYATTSGNRTVSFQAPESSLSIDAQQEGATLRAADFQLRLSDRLELLASRGELHLDGSMQLETGALDASAERLMLSGNLSASDAPITLSATESLTATASSSITATAGNVTLDAQEGELLFSGTIDVSDKSDAGVGGKVKLLGNEVSLLSGALIDATGTRGGGEVFIGGDYLGSNPNVRNANLTYMDADAAINASAIQSGDGGKVIVWADDTAIVAGSHNIAARGGAEGGNGGFIETSGKRYLAIGGAASASAVNGLAGTWLLDPYNVTINNTGTAILTAGVLTATANNTQINVSTITAALAAGTNVTINTGTGGTQDGNITLDAPLTVNMNGNNATLTLNAANDILIDDAITASNGQLTVVLNANASGGVNDDGNATAGNVTVAAAIATNGGDFRTTGVQFSSTATISTAGGDIELTHTGTITIGANINTGAGTSTISSTTGNIAFSGNSSLTTASASLTATAGAITSGTATNDINTATANGNVVLASGAAIGTSGNRIAVSIGTGTISATTTGAGTAGDINISSAASLRLGAFSTAGGSAQAIRITTTGASSHITLGTSSSGNDNWTVVSGGNFTATGTHSITAGTISINAGGSILSNGVGVDFVTSGTGDALVLTAALGVGTSVDAIEATVASPGLISMVADTQGINFLYLGGALNFSRFGTVKAAAANQVIEISTENGNIVVDDTTPFTDLVGSDTLILRAQGGSSDISFTGTEVLQAKIVELYAAGDVTSDGAGTDIEVSTGDLVVPRLAVIAESIGASTTPLSADLNGGTVSLSASVGGIYFDADGGDFSTDQITTLSAAGTGVTIQLGTSAGDFTIDSLTGIHNNTANDNWIVRAGGTGDLTFANASPLNVVTFSGDAAGDVLRTGNGPSVEATSVLTAITLEGTNLGQVGNALQFSAPSGKLSFSATGDVYYEQATGDLDLDQFILLSSSGIGSVISLEAVAGNVDLSSLGGFVATSDDNFTIVASGDVNFGSVTLFAASVTVNAGGSILSGTAATDINTAGFDGNISLTGALGIGAGPADSIIVNAGNGVVDLTTSDLTGDISLQSDGVLNLGTISTVAGEQTVNISVPTSSLSFTSAVTTDDNWVVYASGDIQFVGANHTLTVNTLVMTSDSNITTDGQGTDIAVVGTTGGVLILEANNIGADTLPIAISRLSGTQVSFTALDGDIFLNFVDSSLDFSDLQLSTGLPANRTVSIAAAGQITIDDLTNIDVSTNDDNWLLETTGANADILFAAATPLTVLSLDATATGNIYTTATTVSVDATSFNQAITLTGASVGGNPDAGGLALRLNIEAGAFISVESGSDIGISIVDGDFNVSQLTLFSSSAAGSTIYLGIENGILTFDDTTGFVDTTDDNWVIEGSSNLLFTGPTLEAASVKITVDGLIEQSFGLDIDTSAFDGDITLITQLGVGVNAPVRIAAGNGIVRATAATSGGINLASLTNFNVGLMTTNAGAVDNINLRTFGGGDDLRFVESSSTNDNWLLSSQGNIELVDDTFLDGNIFFLFATDDVVSGTHDYDLKSTSALQEIEIIAGSIGSTTNPLVLDQAFTGLYAQATVGDLAIEIVAGDITLSTLDLFSAVGVGVNVYLKTRSGDITIDVDSNTSDIFDDNLTFIAEGAASDIILDIANPLVAASVNLQAGGKLVTSAANPPIDIDTSGTNGDITIFAASGIGEPGDPLKINPGTGVVSLSTTETDGDIFVRSDTQFNLGQISTGADIQTIEVGTLNGDLIISDPSGSNDDWRLIANGNIIFQGDGSLSANTAFLFANNTIYSDTAGIDIDTSASNGAIFISSAYVGTVNQRLEVNAGTGTYEIDSVFDVYLGFYGGDLFTSQFVGLDTNALPVTIDLLVENGDLIVDSAAGFTGTSTSGNWVLTTNTGFDVVFDNTTLQVGSLVVDSGGSILGGSNPGTDIRTTAGGIDLTAAGDIGESGNSLNIDLPNNFTPITAAAGTNVYLESADSLLVDTITTDVGTGTISVATLNPGSTITINSDINSDDNWILNSASDVIFNPAGTLRAVSVSIVADGNIVGNNGAVDIEVLTAGNNLYLAAQNIGTFGTPIDLILGADTQLEVIATGSSVALNMQSGDFRTSQFATLVLQGGTGNILLTTLDGSLYVDSTAGFDSSTNDDFFLLNAIATDADIVFENNTTLLAAQALLNANRNIVSGAALYDVDTSASQGSITLQAGGMIGAQANEFAVNTGSGLTAGLLFVSTSSVGGDIYLESGDTLNIGTLTTNGAESQFIELGGGEVILSNIFTTNDDWELFGSNIIFNNAAMITARSVQISASNAVTSGTGIVDIDVSAPGGSLIVSAITGTADNPLEVNLGDSDLSLYSTGGDSYVNFHGGDLRGSQILALSVTSEDATIQLTALNGDILLDNLDGFQPELFDMNAHLILRAQSQVQGVMSNIDLDGGTLRAGNVTLEAMGSISGNLGGGVDIQTAPDGIVRLVAIGEVDQNYDPVQGGEIGSALNPMILATSGIEAISTGNQYYSANPTLRLLALDAGNSTIFLQSGTFYLDGFTDSTVLSPGVTFGGDGIVKGDLIAPGIVTLAPGMGEGQAGQIIVVGNATFGPGTEFVFDINSPYQIPGRDYDQLQVFGSLDITGNILSLEGGEALQQTISDITLIDMMDPNSQVIGQFVLGEGSIDIDGKVSIGNFSSNIFYTGGSGNDVVLSNISLVPPIQNTNYKAPSLRFIAFSRDFVPIADNDVQPPQLSPVEPPIIEADVDGVAVRKVQVSLLTPIDDEGNFLEEVVLTLDVEWLKNLSALFRRLPDDRYRLYLILEGGEKRRVMDVVIRDGRPFEPEENRDLEPASKFVAPPPMNEGAVPTMEQDSPTELPPTKATSTSPQDVNEPAAEPLPTGPTLQGPTLNAPTTTPLRDATGPAVSPLERSSLDDYSGSSTQYAYVDDSHAYASDFVASETVRENSLAHSGVFAAADANEIAATPIRFVPATAGIAMVLASAGSAGDWQKAVDGAVIAHSRERLSRRGRLQAKRRPAER